MKSWENRSKAVLAQGCTGTNSKRPSQYVRGVYPTHCHMANGPYIWGTDNRRYIDFVGGLGTIILGYNHPKVEEAVNEIRSQGVVSGSLPHPIEVETAELIRSMFPQIEKVRFLKTGSEACSAAVRIARAHTDKSYIKSDGYHGHHDLFTSMSPPAYGVKDDFRVMKAKSRNTYGNMAGHITEPITLSATEKDREKLKEKVLFCRDQKSLVIFDEVITGCRVLQHSVGRMWPEMDPDITVLGKAIANGYPLAIVGGKKRVMDSKEYFISSTFSGEAVSLAACKATLEEIRKKNMKDLWFYAQRFIDNFNEMCRPINVEIEGYGTRGMMRVTNHHTALFMQEACKAGMLFGKAFFYNFSHMENNIEDYVFNLIDDIVTRIRSGAAQLEGELPKETFIR